MSEIDPERLAAWAAETRRIGFERRDWWMVRRLGGATVGLLAGGLAADLTDAPPAVKLGCWTGAALSGAAMLIWMYDRRRFTRTPDLYSLGGAGRRYGPDPVLLPEPSRVPPVGDQRVHSAVAGL